MTHNQNLTAMLNRLDLSLNRLYSVEIEHTTGSAPNSKWNRIAILHDVHDMNASTIAEEVHEIANGRAGKWRITLYYWSGIIKNPELNRFMGHGENFAYSPNPYGDCVLKFEPSIEFEILENQI